MSRKTENQVVEMKKQTIGVEVEMNSITREKAAKIAAEFFGTERYQNTADRNGYCAWSAWDEAGREWKFQKDVSIAGPDSEKCEMVTPILTYADMEILQELIRRLRKRERKAMPQEAAAFTFTSAPKDTRLRRSETSLTSWQATKSFWQALFTLTRIESTATAKRSIPDSWTSSTAESPARWRRLRTSGIAARMPTTTGAGITTTAVTIC